METVKRSLATGVVALWLLAISSCGGSGYLGNLPFPVDLGVSSSIELSALIMPELMNYYTFQVLVKGNNEYPVLFIERKIDGVRLVVMDGKTLAVKARYTQAELESIGIPDFKGKTAFVDVNGAFVIGNIRFADLSQPPEAQPAAFNPYLPGFAFPSAPAGSNAADIVIDHSLANDTIVFHSYPADWKDPGAPLSWQIESAGSRFDLFRLLDDTASAKAILALGRQGTRELTIAWLPKSDFILGPFPADFMDPAQLAGIPNQRSQSAGGPLPDDIDLSRMSLTEDGLVARSASSNQWILFDQNGEKDRFSIDSEGKCMIGFGWTLDHHFTFDVENRRVQRVRGPR